MIESFGEEGIFCDIGVDKKITLCGKPDNISALGDSTILKTKDAIIDKLEGEIERLECENIKLQSTYRNFWEKIEVLSQSRKLLTRELAGFRRAFTKNRFSSESIEPSTGWAGQDIFGNLETSLEFSGYEESFDLDLDCQEMVSPLSSLQITSPELSRSVLTDLTPGVPSKIFPEHEEAGCDIEPTSETWNVDQKDMGNARSPSSCLNYSIVSDPFASFLEDEEPRKRTSNSIYIPEENMTRNTKEVQVDTEDKTSPPEDKTSPPEDKTSPPGSLQYGSPTKTQYIDSGLHDDGVFTNSSSDLKQLFQSISNWEKKSFPKSTFSESSEKVALPYDKNVISPPLESAQVAYEFFEPVVKPLRLKYNLLSTSVQPDIKLLEKQQVLSISLNEKLEVSTLETKVLCIESPTSQISVPLSDTPMRFNSSCVNSSLKWSCNPVRKTVQVERPGVKRTRGIEVEGDTNKPDSIRCPRSTNSRPRKQESVGCFEIANSGGLISSSVKKIKSKKEATSSYGVKCMHRRQYESNRAKRVGFKQNVAIVQHPSRKYKKVDTMSKAHQCRTRSQFMKTCQLNPSLTTRAIKYSSKVDKQLAYKRDHAKLEREVLGGRKPETSLSNKRRVTHAKNELAPTVLDPNSHLMYNRRSIRRLQAQSQNKRYSANPKQDSPQFRTSTQKRYSADNVLYELEFTNEEQLRDNIRYSDSGWCHGVPRRNIRVSPVEYRNVPDNRSHIKVGKLTIWKKSYDSAERISKEIPRNGRRR